MIKITKEYQEQSIQIKCETKPDENGLTTSKQLDRIQEIIITDTMYILCFSTYIDPMPISDYGKFTIHNGEIV